MKVYTAADYQSEMEAADPRMEELAYLRDHLGSSKALLAQSQPLQGQVLTERGPMQVAEAIAAFGVGPVRYRFGTWVVTEDGVACLVRHFPLSQERLHTHEDWASHLAVQPWVNLWDLLRALVVARQAESHWQQGGPSGSDAHPS